jgi:protein gp37
MADLFHPAVSDSLIVDVFAIMQITPRHTYQLQTKHPGRMRQLLNRPDFGLAVWAAACALSPDAEVERLDLDEPWHLPNLWLGVSVANQPQADLRIPALLDVYAAVTFVNCQPLLGSINLSDFLGTVHQCPGVRHTPTSDYGHTFSCCTNPALDWVVAGGESGAKARPTHPDWARGLRDQCVATSVPFTFAGWGAWRPAEPGDAFDRREPVAFDGPRGIGWTGPAAMVRVGAEAAGRVLDGRTWDELPRSYVALQTWLRAQERVL